MNITEKKERKRNLGPALILVAALLWAVDGVIRRYLYSLSPITIIFFEHLFGLIILFPFVAKYVFKTKLTKREWWLLVLVATLSGLLGTLWFTTALLQINFISFSVVFLLQKLQPIFAISSARIFLKEKLSKNYLFWAITALIAAYFVTFKDGIVNLDTGKGTIIAAIYALGAAFAWGTSTTFSKMLLGKIRSDVSTFYRFFFTVLLAVPIILFGGYAKTLLDPSVEQFGLFVLIAVSTGMVALLIYYRGLATTPVHISTILELAFPFVAIFIDMKLYGNVLSVSQLIAAIILIFSIYKVSQFETENENAILPS